MALSAPCCTQATCATLPPHSTLHLSIDRVGLIDALYPRCHFPLMSGADFLPMAQAILECITAVRNNFQTGHLPTGRRFPSIAFDSPPLLTPSRTRQPSGECNYQQKRSGVRRLYRRCLRNSGGTILFRDLGNAETWSECRGGFCGCWSQHYCHPICCCFLCSPFPPLPPLTLSFRAN